MSKLQNLLCYWYFQLNKLLIKITLCSCVMKLCLTTTNGILETPIRTFQCKSSELVKIKYFVIKNIKHFHTNTGHSQTPPGTLRNYFRLVHLGSEVQLLSQITAENKCWKRSRWCKSWRLLKNTQHFHTNLGHLGGTLEMFTNYFWEVRFVKNCI